MATVVEDCFVVYSVKRFHSDFCGIPEVYRNNIQSSVDWRSLDKNTIDVELSSNKNVLAFFFIKTMIFATIALILQRHMKRIIESCSMLRFILSKNCDDTVVLCKVIRREILVCVMFPVHPRYIDYVNYKGMLCFPWTTYWNSKARYNEHKSMLYFQQNSSWTLKSRYLEFTLYFQYNIPNLEIQIR